MFLTFKKTKFKICQKLNFSLEPARLFSENLETHRFHEGSFI